MKVTIDAGGRKVEIETADQNVTPETVGKHALELWHATESAGCDRSAGPAFGLAAQAQLTTNRSTYGPASFRHGDRPVVDA